jgi:hypothetical protein
VNKDRNASRVCNGVLSSRTFFYWRMRHRAKVGQLADPV